MTVRGADAALRAFVDTLTRQLGDVLAPLASARSLPRAAFVDPRSFALDAIALFGGRVGAAHADDLDRPGAWARCPFPDRTDLAVVRGTDLALSLLSTLCRHRSVPLVEGPVGLLPSLELACGYHGWRYDLDGALRRAPGLSPAVPACDVSLRAGHAAAQGPFVFATRGLGAAPPLPGLPPWLVRADLDVLRRVHVATHVARANWKLLVANFQESHHFPTVHPGLEAQTPARASTSIIPEHDAWLGGTMDLLPGRETVSPSGSRDGRRFIAAEEDRGRVHDAWMAPNLLTSLQPDYLLTYRLEPEAVDRTRIVFSVGVHGGCAEAQTTDGIEALVRFWSTTNAEDRAICEAQQRGLEAGPEDLAAGPRVLSEDGLDAFEKIVARAYLAFATVGARP